MEIKLIDKEICLWYELPRQKYIHFFLLKWIPIADTTTMLYQLRTVLSWYPLFYIPCFAPLFSIFFPYQCFGSENLNSWIIVGISYLSKRQEAEALRRLNLAYEDELSASWSNLKEVRDIPLVNMADILFTERMKNRFREWCDGLVLPHNGGLQFEGCTSDSKQFETTFFKTRPALSLNGFNSHQLRLIQLVIFYL